MPLKRDVFDVYMNTEPTTEHRVEVTPADHIAGERLAMSRLIPLDAGLTMSYVFVWHALARLGHYEGTYDEFVNADCAGFDRVTLFELPDVPPTRPAASTGSGSSSPLTSPEPLTGSTPTSIPTS